MGFQNYTTVNVEAGEDLKQYGAVELNAGKAELTDGNGDDVFGICVTQDKDAKEGDQVAIAVDGVIKCLIDGSGTSLSLGDELMPKGSATSGKLVKNTGGNALVGMLVEPNIDGTIDGEIARVRLYGDRTETS